MIFCLKSLCAKLFLIFVIQLIFRLFVCFRQQFNSSLNPQPCCSKNPPAKFVRLATCLENSTNFGLLKGGAQLGNFVDSSSVLLLSTKMWSSQIIIYFFCHPYNFLYKKWMAKQKIQTCIRANCQISIEPRQKTKTTSSNQ